MSLPPDAAFFEKQEQELCAYNPRSGCTGKPSQTIPCITEGTQNRYCDDCARTWRAISAIRGGQGYCPLCIDTLGTRHLTKESPITERPVQAPLTGLIADAINKAMHQEGLTIDIRNRVLARIAGNDPWIYFLENTRTDNLREILRHIEVRS